MSNYQCPNPKCSYHKFGSASGCMVCKELYPLLKKTEHERDDAIMLLKQVEQERDDAIQNLENNLELCAVTKNGEN